MASIRYVSLDRRQSEWVHHSGVIPRRIKLKDGSPASPAWGREGHEGDRSLIPLTIERAHELAEQLTETWWETDTPPFPDGAVMALVRPSYATFEEMWSAILRGLLMEVEYGAFEVVELDGCLEEGGND